jgi:hypothetical protein
MLSNKQNQKLAHSRYAALLPASLVFSVFLGNIAIALVKTDVAIAQDVTDSEIEAKPRKGDANTLRSLQGEPVTPTNGNLFDRQVVDPNSDVNLQNVQINLKPIVTVTPSIPNASPLSPNLNVPGAFTTDPLHAIPLFQGSGDAITPAAKEPQK